MSVIDKELQLFEAVEENDVARVQELIDDAVSVNMNLKDLPRSAKNDRFLIQTCCKKGHLDCLKLLVRNGAFLEARDAWGETPLMNSVICEWSELVEYLILSGCDINARDRNGRTAVHFAVDNTSTACLEHLLVAKADIDACDTYGRTPVWYAANPTRSVDAVRRLNNAGCNVDLSDLRWQRSPLQVSVLAGDVHKVALLLEAGSDADSLDILNTSPLMNLIKHHHSTAGEKELKMVCLLLESGADINLNTKLGTALVMAGRYETEPTLTNFLLANGADPDLTGGISNVSALYHAASWNHLKVVKSLIRANCRLDTVTSSRFGEHTPFGIAVWKGHFNIAKLLLQSGYNLHKEKYLYTNQSIPDELGKNAEMLKWLREISQTPFSLQRQSCQRIRLLLGRGLRNSVKSLPLPPAIHSYILLVQILNE